MAPDTLMDLVGVWIAGVLTLCVYSFLFRDNVLYRITEALFVGGSVGLTIVLVYWNGFYPKIFVPFLAFIREFRQQTSQDYVWAAYMLVSFFLGTLFLSRFSPKHAWVSRYPMAYIIGIGSGMAIPLTFQTFIFQQTSATFVPLIVRTPAGIDWTSSLGNTALIVGVLTVLYYFFFSLKKTDPVSRAASRIGIAYLMIGFGASFGYTVMARVSLLIGRVDFLKDEWVLGTLRYFGVI